MNPPDPADFVAPAYRSIGESLVRELGKLMVDPEMVSLAGGYPGPELFDREGLRAAVDEALREMPVPALQYGPTEGLPGLREQVARLLEARGTKASAGDVLVTGGSQQGFDLLVRTLLRAGDATGSTWTSSRRCCAIRRHRARSSSTSCRPSRTRAARRCPARGVSSCSRSRSSTAS
jgi:hypothetical protein